MMPASDPAATFARLLVEASDNPRDAAIVIDLAEAALAVHGEEEALAVVADAILLSPSDAALWQWKGLLHRATDQHEEALQSFQHAARLRPVDPLVRHSLARTSLEAGRPASALFDAALALDPMNSEVLLGRAAARCAEGDLARAQDEIDLILKQHPGWLQGHELAVKLRWMQGRADECTETLERALVLHPQDPALWSTLIALLSQANAFEDVVIAAGRSKLAIGTHRRIAVCEAAALSELKHVVEADAAFSRLGTNDDISVAVHRVRHALRNGRPEQARRQGEPWVQTPAANLMWPYLSLAWRILGDPRWEWLEGEANFIRVFDLNAALPNLNDLASVLHRIHARSSQPFDQSVRRGLQSDGMLFQRIEPEIKAVRTVLTDAVATYVDGLPPQDAAHPLLRYRRDQPVRFSGAWSVLLPGSGHHANHNHPAGWLSSAFYVAIPDRTAEDGPQAGAITFGIPQTELGIDLPPIRTIHPKPGQLVLFPSTMWHGTTAFNSGDRMTIAFDIAPPRP